MIVRGACLAGSLALGAVAALDGCGVQSTFGCTQSSECSGGAAGGLCEPQTGFCSFPDDACDSMRRYGEFAGDGLAGLCVEDPAGGSGTETNASAATVGTTSSTSSGTAPDASTSGDASGTTALTDTDTDTDATTTSTTGEEPPPVFFDDFERPDSAELGNGWVELDPSAFSLQAGTAVYNNIGGNYKSNVVVRPADEEILDVTATVEFRFSEAPLGDDFPQLFARVQTDTLTSGPDVRGYLCYLQTEAEQLNLQRLDGGDIAVGLGSDSFDLNFGPQAVYRLEFRVRQQGSTVELLCNLQQAADRGWVSVSAVLNSDTDDMRITTPGVVGFSANGSNESFSYDNFSAAPADP